MIQKSFDTPWKVWNEIARRITYPWTRFIFMLNGIPWGFGWKIYGTPIVQKHRRSHMYFGDGLSLRSTTSSNPLGPNHPVILCTWQKGANLEVGDNFAMTGGSLVSALSITIGNDVSIGANSSLMDTDFHPLVPMIREIDPDAGQAAPIIVESNVFIGMNCIILKGVTIGCGSVVGAGSVVTDNVPPGMIAAGNPARVIKAVNYQNSQPLHN